MTYTTNHTSQKLLSTPKIFGYINNFISILIPLLAQFELSIVRFFCLTARPLLLKYSAVAISKLGNGWIYLILVSALYTYAGNKSLPIIFLGMINAATLHFLYPVIKRRFCRRRPFIIDIKLTSLLKTLDDHSFPSGHTMTLTGVLTPIVIAWPSMSYSAFALVTSLAWSRIATAHHFPSDVVAGIAMGLGIAYPLSIYTLPLIINSL